MITTNSLPKLYRLMNRDGSFNISTSQKRGFWGDLYHGLMRISWASLIGLILSFYFIINFVFACLYYAYGPGVISGVDQNQIKNHFLDMFFFSVQTFATIGYGQMAPVGVAANITVTIEAFIGMLTLALATGLVFSRFSRPSSKIIFSQIAVITTYEGKPCFSLRMANGRYNQLVQASVELVLTREETTHEGQKFRKIYNLPLHRNHSAIFSATWTLFHFIDEKSPFHNQTLKNLNESVAEIVVSVTGLDGTSSQTIHASSSYIASEIIWNARFQDMLTRMEDGTLQIRLEKISEYEINKNNAS